MEVQPVEVKLATCLQVVLNAGWSISSENWDDFLDVSGVSAVRADYWEAYNNSKFQLMMKMAEDRSKTHNQRLFSEPDCFSVQVEDLEHQASESQFSFPTKHPQISIDSASSNEDQNNTNE